MTEPLNVFISYSHQDEGSLQELIKHLSGLVHQELIAPWHDRDIDAGTQWAEQIDRNLERSFQV